MAPFVSEENQNENRRAIYFNIVEKSLNMGLFPSEQFIQNRYEKLSKTKMGHKCIIIL